MDHLPLDCFRERLPDTLRLLRRLVETESPSTDKTALDAIGAIVAEELRLLGAGVTVHTQPQAGDHVVGTWLNDERRPEILLLCHMDTVFDVGTLAQRPLREANGRLYGPGVYDMKGGIAIVLSALRALRDSKTWPRRPITALFTSDEETGSATSRHLIEALARRAGLVLCLEPALPDGAIKTARKGVGSLEIEARGVAAHAGSDHDKGRNAIEELAHHVLAAQRLTDYGAGTTVNVGLIQGGARTNVVPDYARAEADFRVALPTEIDRLAAWARNITPVLPGTQVSVRIDVNRPPMPRDATMIATFERVRDIATALGIALREGSTGGASDANFVAPLGVPVLDGLGPLGDGGHSEREYIEIASLPERAALLAATVREW